MTQLGDNASENGSNGLTSSRPIATQDGPANRLLGTSGAIDVMPVKVRPVASALGGPPEEVSAKRDGTAVVHVLGGHPGGDRAG